MVKFRCLQRGYCCKRYWIPVTHLDVLRLIMYGNYDPLDVLEPLETSIYPAPLEVPTVRFDNGEYYIALRMKLDGSCIFLDYTGKCRVHEYKPMVCRFYPFVYIVRDGDIVIEVNAAALGECPGLILDPQPIPQHVIENLRRLARVRIEELERWRRVVDEWNRGSSIPKNFENFVRFAICKAKEDYRELLEKGLWVK